MAEVPLNWFAAFGVAREWIFDQGSRFKNTLTKLLAKTLRADSQFTLSHCLWSNSSVEVKCSELVRTCRSLLSDFQLPQNPWPTVLPLIQSALNRSPTKRLDGDWPLTGFTSLPQDSPFDIILRSNEEVTTVTGIEKRQAEALQQLADLHVALGTYIEIVPNIHESKERPRWTPITAAPVFKKLTSQKAILFWKLLQRKTSDRKPAKGHKDRFKYYTARTITFLRSQTFSMTVRSLHMVAAWNCLETKNLSRQKNLTNTWKPKKLTTSGWGFSWNPPPRRKIELLGKWSGYEKKEAD